LDRAQVVASLGYLDGGLVQLSRGLLSSAYTRYALIAYLGVVHLFALTTLLDILNPDMLAELEGFGELEHKA
jgi:hypothetical protein